MSTYGNEAGAFTRNASEELREREASDARAAEMLARKRLHRLARLNTAPVREGLPAELDFVRQELMPAMINAAWPVSVVLGWRRVRRASIPEGSACQELYRRVFVQVLRAYEAQAASTGLVGIAARFERPLAERRIRLGGRRNTGLLLFESLANLIEPAKEYESAAPGKDRHAALKRELQRAADPAWKAAAVQQHHRVVLAPIENSAHAEPNVQHGAPVSRSGGEPLALPPMSPKEEAVLRVLAEREPHQPITSEGIAGQLSKKELPYTDANGIRSRMIPMFKKLGLQAHGRRGYSFTREALERVRKALDPDADEMPIRGGS
jgi:hypothetical protein